MVDTVAQIAERALRRLGVSIVPLADRPALSTTIPMADLATRALISLAVIAADETPSGLDQALAVSKVAAVHDGLVAQAFVSWDDASIPQAVSEDYTLLTALHLAAAFGKTADPAQQPVLEARVRQVALIMTAPDLAIDAVLGVHADLAARGLVRWTVFDIPEPVADAYASLASVVLAPQFGRKADSLDEASASMSLARYIALPSSGERVRTEYF